MILNKEAIRRKFSFFPNHVIISLIIVGIVGVGLRLYNFPYGIPVTLDATLYFWYAVDTNVLGHFPADYTFPNTGWPMLLSVFFSVIHSNNFIDYMTVQRFVTVAVSLITIIPVYFVCKRFFNKSFALIGAALFAVEPHIVQNSILGITDSLYVFLISTSFAFLFSENKKLVYISFAVAALSASVRYEGLLFLAVLTTIFFTRFKINKKSFLQYALVFGIYWSILLPIMFLRIHDVGDDGLTSHIIEGAKVTNRIAANQSDISPDLASFVLNGVENLFKYLGWIMIPYFVIIASLGAIIALKNKDRRLFSVILAMFILIIPSVYAYARGIQETRYLLVLMPFFSILSLFFIEKIWNKDFRNVIIILILSISVGTSFAYIEIKKIDITHEREAYEIGLQVSKITDVTNVYYPESKYLKIATIPQDRFPLSSNTIPKITTTLSTDGFSSLSDFIKNNKSAGLTHIAIDDDKSRPEFMKDVFNNIERYPYLVKVYDSNEYGYKYRLIVYKINYDLFDG